MWREEVQRHVAPVITLLRIELVHRQQLDYGDAEFLQVWDLLDQSKEGSAFFGCDAGVGMRRETFDVQLVDDRVVRVPRCARRHPSQTSSAWARQHAQRCAPVVRSRLQAASREKSLRKMHRRCKRVEQNFLRIKPLTVAGSNGPSARHA